ncbi:MAG: hypothetical protein Q9221_004715 [Calogaya cf. arnoldii]
MRDSGTNDVERPSRRPCDLTQASTYSSEHELLSLHIDFQSFTFLYLQNPRFQPLQHQNKLAIASDTMFGTLFSKLLSNKGSFPFKSSNHYSQVISEDGSDSEKSTLNGVYPPLRWLRPQKMSARQTGFMLTSGCLNIVLMGITIMLWMLPPPEVSHWAKLSWDTQRPYMKRTPYSSTNLEEANRLWETSLDIDTGMLALTDDFVRKQGLPTISGRFPWDENKSIFFVSGFHDLHCLKSIHMSITEWNLGHNQTYELKHIIHCLDAVRDAIICQADDTPRFTSFPEQKDLPTQTRMCRSWNKLSRWAAQPQHTACYRYLSEHARHLDQHERYKFCTKETGYADVVKGWFRKQMEKELPDYYPQITGADEI